MNGTHKFGKDFKRRIFCLQVVVNLLYHQLLLSCPSLTVSKKKLAFSPIPKYNYSQKSWWMI